MWPWYASRGLRDDVTAVVVAFASPPYRVNIVFHQRYRGRPTDVSTVRLRGSPRHCCCCVVGRDGGRARGKKKNRLRRRRPHRVRVWPFVGSLSILPVPFVVCPVFRACAPCEVASFVSNRISGRTVYEKIEYCPRDDFYFIRRRETTIPFFVSEK